MDNNLGQERTTGDEDMPQLQGHCGSAKSQTMFFLLGRRAEPEKKEKKQWWGNADGGVQREGEWCPELAAGWMFRVE